MLSILSVIIPFASAIAAFLLPGKQSRQIAFLSVALTFAIAVIAGWQMNGDTSFEHVFRFPWVESAGIELYFGMDSISHSMLLLSGFSAFFAVLTAARSELPNTGKFLGLLLLMQAAMNGAFVSLDLFVYYIFWELSLIPAIFLLLLWGQGNTRKTTLLFFIYTLAGSLLMLVAIFWLGLAGPSTGFSFEKMQSLTLQPNVQVFILIAFFLAYAIKIPLFPFHSWQADTYATAPVPLTMMLSGVMLKMALFSIIRWVLPIVPDALQSIGPVFLYLAVTGVVYASVIALRQQELIRLFAWSSMAHVGLIAAGILTLSQQGIQGAILQMMAHSLNSVAILFVAAIFMKNRSGLLMHEMGALRRDNPYLGGIFLLFVFSSIAVPLTAGFPGELLLLSSLFSWNPWISLLAGTSIIIGAVYMLKAYQSIMLGPVKEGKGSSDETALHIDFTDKILLLVLCALIFSLGLYPQWLLDWVNAPTLNLIPSLLLPQ